MNCCLVFSFGMLNCVVGFRCISVCGWWWWLRCWCCLLMVMRCVGVISVVWRLLFCGSGLVSVLVFLRCCWCCWCW